MCHVLIIEDEPLVAMDLEALLESEGATSFAFAASQNEAISQALARRPAFITSDVNLSEGTGPLAVEAILFALGPIPVVFITGTPDVCSPCSSEDLILAKPFSHAAIVQAFHYLVASQPN